MNRNNNSNDNKSASEDQNYKNIFLSSVLIQNEKKNNSIIINDNNSSKVSIICDKESNSFSDTNINHLKVNINEQNEKNSNILHENINLYYNDFFNTNNIANKNNIKQNYPDINEFQHNKNELESIYFDKKEENNPISNDKKHENDIDLNLSICNHKIFHQDSIKKTISINLEDYLTIKDFDILEFSGDKKEDLAFKDNTEKIIDFIRMKFNLKNFTQTKVGLMENLEYYIKNRFDILKNLNYNPELFENFKKTFHMYRLIGGDGNCFYRAVIFSYLENIIYDKNKDLLLRLIYDVKQTFKISEYKLILESNNIKKENTTFGLYLIYKILFEDYKIFLNEKSQESFTAQNFLFCLINIDKFFDLGLILFLRFKIKGFIEENKQKLYSQQFSVRMGNLLPEKYEIKNDQFDWDNFYKEKVLKLYSEAENIIIYVIPYILKVDLKIYTYGIGNTIEEQFKEIKCFLDNKYSLSVFYRNMHYEVMYSKEFYDKNLLIIKKNKNNYNEILNPIVNFKEKNKIGNNSEKNIKENLDYKNYPNEDKIKDNKSMTKVEIQEIFLEKKIENEENLIDVKKKIDIKDFNYCTICKNLLEKDYIEKFEILICRTCIVKETKSLITAKYLELLFNTIQISNSVDLEISTCIAKNKIIYNCPISNVYESNVKDFIYKIPFDFNHQKLNFEKIKSITNLQELKILKNIKNNFCISCGNEIINKEKFNFKLPCDCNFCDPICFNNHIELIKKRNKFNINYEYFCLCGYKYNFREFFKLMRIIMLHQKEKQYLKHFNLILKNQIKSICFKCNAHLYQEIKTFKVFIEINNIKNIMDINILDFEFHHFICLACVLEEFNFQEENNLFFEKIQKEINSKDMICEKCDWFHKFIRIENNFLHKSNENNHKNTKQNSNEDKCIVF